MTIPLWLLAVGGSLAFLIGGLWLGRPRGDYDFASAFIGCGTVLILAAFWIGVGIMWLLS